MRTAYLPTLWGMGERGTSCPMSEVGGTCLSSDGHQMALAGGCTVRSDVSWVMVTWGPLNRITDRHL